MRSYLTLLNKRTLTLFQYRAAALAGLTTQLFWGIIKTMILAAFYSQAAARQPISLSQAAAFIWLGQAFLQLLPWNLDKDIEEEIRNGNVAYQLVRPLDLYSVWFIRCLSLRSVPTLLRCLPIFLIAVLFFDLPLPYSIGGGALFLLSLVFAALLSAAITASVLITLFWTISGEGILRLLPHLVVLCSGMVVPIPLFPQWAQPFLNAQPLRGIIDIPARLYLGLIPANDAYLYIGFQCLWILFFIALGKALMARALKSFVVEGG